MPEAFEKCIANKGRVRRISGPNKQFGLGEGEYINVCFLENEMFRGEVHKKAQTAAETREKQGPGFWQADIGD